MGSELLDRKHPTLTEECENQGIVEEVRADAKSTQRPTMEAWCKVFARNAVEQGRDWVFDDVRLGPKPTPRTAATKPGREITKAVGSVPSSDYGRFLHSDAVGQKVRDNAIAKTETLLAEAEQNHRVPRYMFFAAEVGEDGTLHFLEAAQLASPLRRHFLRVAIEIGDQAKQWSIALFFRVFTTNDAGREVQVTVYGHPALLRPKADPTATLDRPQYRREMQRLKVT